MISVTRPDRSPEMALSTETDASLDLGVNVVMPLALIPGDSMATEDVPVPCCSMASAGADRLRTRSND